MTNLDMNLQYKIAQILTSGSWDLECRQTVRQTDRQREQQTDRERQTDREIQRERQTDVRDRQT